MPIDQHWMQRCTACYELTSPKKFDLREIIDIAKRQFAFPLDGTHGIAHWERVRQNGHKLAKQTASPGRYMRKKREKEEKEAKRGTSLADLVTAIGLQK